MIDCECEIDEYEERLQKLQEAEEALRKYISRLKEDIIALQSGNQELQD